MKHRLIVQINDDGSGSHTKDFSKIYEVKIESTDAEKNPSPLRLFAYLYTVGSTYLWKKLLGASTSHSIFFMINSQSTSGKPPSKIILFPKANMGSSQHLPIGRFDCANGAHLCFRRAKNLSCAGKEWVEGEEKHGKDRNNGESLSQPP